MSKVLLFQNSRVAAMVAAVVAFGLISGCSDEVAPADGTTPYKWEVPATLARVNPPAGNPLTEEGIALGRKLFYDPILSKYEAQSCGDCHAQ